MCWVKKKNSSRKLAPHFPSLVQSEVFFSNLTLSLFINFVPKARGPEIFFPRVSPSSSQNLLFYHSLAWSCNVFNTWMHSLKDSKTALTSFCFNECVFQRFCKVYFLRRYAVIYLCLFLRVLKNLGNLKIDLWHLYKTHGLMRYLC